MAEKQGLDTNIKQELKKFFNSKVSLYTSGSNSTDFTKRPFMSVLPKEEPIFVGSHETDISAFSVAMGAEALSEMDKKTSTKNTEFLTKIEERYRKAKPDAQFIIIDPDAVRQRYANDDDRNRNIFKSFQEYLGGRLKEEGRDQDFPMRAEDYYQLMEASVLGNSPLSATLPTNPTKMNPKGDGQFSVVISANPDDKMHGMFSDAIGCDKRLAENGLGREDVDEMILTHELGHAMDQKNHFNARTYLDMNYSRHKTECVADAFSVLQMARKNKNTSMGEVVGDIRAMSAARGMQYVSNQIQKYFNKPSGLIFKDKEGEKEFLGKSHDHMPELKNLKKLMQEANKNSGSQKKKASQPKTAKKTNKIASNDNKDVKVEYGKSYDDYIKFQLLNVASSIASYRTTPSVEGACKVADEKLKDGSLEKMSDKEVHDLAVNIVDKTALSKDNYASLTYGLVSGEPTKDLVDIYKRAEKAQNNFPEDPEKQMALQMQAMGMPDPRSQPSEEDYIQLVSWRRDVQKQIQKEGGTRKDLLTVVGKQKDATRKEEDGFLRNAKIVIMNEEFLKESKDTSQTARVIGTVNKAIEEVKPQKIDVKGKDLVGKFLSNQLSQLNALEKYAQKTKETDFSVMSSDEIAKSVNSSVSSVKKAVKFEKYSQDIAKEIKKDKEAMDIVSKSPLIADVEEKASGNHAEWLDVAYKNSAVKDDFLTEVVEKSVMAEKKKLAVFATSDELKPTLNSSVKAKLNKLKKETMQMFAGKKSSETKPNTNAKPEDIVWNRAFNKTGR